MLVRYLSLSYLLYSVFRSTLSIFSFSQTTAHLLCAVLKAEIKSTFHKLNVHAGKLKNHPFNHSLLFFSSLSLLSFFSTALTPSDIKKFFEPVFQQGKIFQTAYRNADESKKAKIKMPFVTVRTHLVFVYIKLSIIHLFTSSLFIYSFVHLFL